MQSIIKIVEEIKVFVTEIENELNNNSSFTYKVSKNIRKSAQNLKIYSADLRKTCSEVYKAAELIRKSKKETKKEEVAE